MTGWGFFFMLLGVCTATSWLFRVIDRIEGKEPRNHDVWN